MAPCLAAVLATVIVERASSTWAYDLEGSVAVTGAAVQRPRDQLGIISGAAHSEDLARQVDDTSGPYFVPAFSGLFVPYSRADRRSAATTCYCQAPHRG
jgi:glycerol kinase